MKKTEMDRIERELKRKEKKDMAIADSGVKSGSVTDYINQLHSRFRYDHVEIFNITTDENILELLEEIKESLPEKKWEHVMKKSIKKTGIQKKDKALEELKTMIA